MNAKQRSEIVQIITAYNRKNKYEVSVDDFIYHGKRYIKAIKEGRMVCSIGSVSSSGMSRTIKFVEVARGKRGGQVHYNVMSFYQFFTLLEYTPVKNSDYFRISGCGMDMVFHTNYSIIGQLQRLGLVEKAVSEKLRQATPPVI